MPNSATKIFLRDNTDFTKETTSIPGRVLLAPLVIKFSTVIVLNIKQENNLAQFMRT